MYKIIIFAGTVEGRKVAEYLNQNRISARVCVATAYGFGLLTEKVCYRRENIWKYLTRDYLRRRWKKLCVPWKKVW